MINSIVLTSRYHSPKHSGGRGGGVIRALRVFLFIFAQLGLAASTAHNGNNNNDIFQANNRAATTPRNNVVSALLRRQAVLSRRKLGPSSSSLSSSVSDIPNRILRSSTRLASYLQDRTSSSTSGDKAILASSLSSSFTSDKSKEHARSGSFTDYEYDDDDYFDSPQQQTPTQPQPQPPSSETLRALQSQLGPYRPYSLTQTHSTSTRTSLTTILTISNILFYAAQTFYPPLTAFGVKRSELILQGQQLHRLITPVFLHASPAHLILNTLSLMRIGPEVERVFGTGRYLATYLLAGVVGNLASSVGTPNPSLGASGAVFGLMGAYVACMGRNERFFGERAMDGVVGTLGMNVVFGFMSRGVDNWAHLGGAAGGVASAIYLGPKLFVLGLPTGGRLIVDRPPLQLPPSLLSLPRKIDARLRKGRIRMQADRYTSSKVPPAKPWKGRTGGGGIGGWGSGSPEWFGRGRRRRSERDRRARGRRERGLPPSDRRMLRPSGGLED